MIKQYRKIVWKHPEILKAFLDLMEKYRTITIDDIKEETNDYEGVLGLSSRIIGHHSSNFPLCKLGKELDKDRWGKCTHCMWHILTCYYCYGASSKPTFHQIKTATYPCELLVACRRRADYMEKRLMYQFGTTDYNEILQSFSPKYIKIESFDDYMVLQKNPEEIYAKFYLDDGSKHFENSYHNSNTKISTILDDWNNPEITFYRKVR